MCSVCSSFLFVGLQSVFITSRCVFCKQDSSCNGAHRALTFNLPLTSRLETEVKLFTPSIQIPLGSEQCEPCEAARPSGRRALLEQLIVRCRWRRKWPLSEGFQLHNNTTFIRVFWSEAAVWAQTWWAQVVLNPGRVSATFGVRRYKNNEQQLSFAVMKDKQRERYARPKRL